MKQVTFLIALFLVSTTCYSQDTSYQKSFDSYNLTKEMLRTWKDDPNGCKKKREFFARDLESNKLLIGIPKKLFITFFGEPDEISESRIYIYIYRVNSDCDSKSNLVTEHMNILVLFTDEKVQSVSLLIFD